MENGDWRAGNKADKADMVDVQAREAVALPIYLQTLCPSCMRPACVSGLEHPAAGR